MKVYPDISVSSINAVARYSLVFTDIQVNSGESALSMPSRNDCPGAEGA
jgi:hypothetical protein